MVAAATPAPRASAPEHRQSRPVRRAKSQSRSRRASKPARCCVCAVVPPMRQRRAARAPNHLARHKFRHAYATGTAGSRERLASAPPATRYRCSAALAPVCPCIDMTLRCCSALRGAAMPTSPPPRRQRGRTHAHAMRGRSHANPAASTAAPSLATT